MYFRDKTSPETKIPNFLKIHFMKEKHVLLTRYFVLCYFASKSDNLCTDSKVSFCTE